MGQRLSWECFVGAVRDEELISKAIQEAARAPTFAEALEVGYKAFGDVACTEAAKEGISAFLQKRSPEFRK